MTLNADRLPPVYRHAYSITHEVDSTMQDTPDRVSCFFPSTRGVVEFRAGDGSTVLLAATGHIRDFIAQRMNEDDEQPSPRANLAPVTRSIIAWPTGSGFEADLIVLERSRDADAQLHAKLVHQYRRSLLVMDRHAGTWRVAETTTLEVGPGETVIGPILSSKAAAALGECLDDVFELCRYPKELARAPHGTPCAYKQMGRCPAACDGSEPMHAYMERFAEAVAGVESGVVVWRGEVEQKIAAASEDLDFERAARIKRRLDCIDKLPIDALDRAGSLHAFSCALVTPAARPGWAMVWVLGGEGCVPLCGVEGPGSDSGAGLEALIERCSAPVGLDRLSMERFSLVARHWFTKPAKARRRRVTILDMRDPRWADGLAAAIADAQQPVDPGHEDEEHTHIAGE